MINNKKKINKIKTDNFLKEFPIIFLLQQNNFTVDDWIDFRQKIQEITKKQEKIEILSVKNSLLKTVLSSSKKSTSLDLNLSKSLFQGPNFLLGCQNDTELKSIWSCINSNSKLVFISCFYNNQILNYLDLEILLKTTNSIHQTLLIQLDKKTELYNTLHNPFKLYPLFHVQQNLLTVLSLMKEQ